MASELHYQLSDSEHAAISEAKRNGAHFERPEMLCRTGSWHVSGTRDPDKVTCERCKQCLKTFLPYRNH